jgi:E3 ubiquitin-protein ligase RNF38/44
MLGMLAEQGGSGHMAGHFGAMRDAVVGMSHGRLPPHLLFSDRDFDENDYEALLALDEGVESRKGAPEDLIEALPLVAVPAEGPDTMQEPRCPICLEDYEPGEVLRALQCSHSHKFHRSCVDKWLKQKATCPICQHDCREHKSNQATA